MKKINKKAATGATIAWIVALVIIGFILFIYILLTLAITKDKDGISISKEKLILEENPILAEKMVVYLKSPVDDKGEILMIDKILESVDVYLEYKGAGGKTLLENEIMNKRLNGDINNLHKYKHFIGASEFLGHDFWSNSGINEKEEFLFKETKKIFGSLCELDPICEDYLLGIPQGTMMGKMPSSSGLPGAFVPEEMVIYNTRDISEWTAWNVFKIPYKDQVIEIKYRELRKL